MTVRRRIPRTGPDILDNIRQERERRSWLQGQSTSDYRFAREQPDWEHYTYVEFDRDAAAAIFALRWGNP